MCMPFRVQSSMRVLILVCLGFLSTYSVPRVSSGIVRADASLTMSRQEVQEANSDLLAASLSVPWWGAWCIRCLVVWERFLIATFISGTAVIGATYLLIDEHSKWGWAFFVSCTVCQLAWMAACVGAVWCVYK